MGSFDMGQGGGVQSPTSKGMHNPIEFVGAAKGPTWEGVNRSLDGEQVLLLELGHPAPVLVVPSRMAVLLADVRDVG